MFERFKNMKMKKLQPTTITGIATIAGTAGCLAVYHYTKDAMLSVATAGGFSAVIHMLIPDNTQLANDAAKIVQDVAAIAPAMNKDQIITAVMNDVAPIANDVNQIRAQQNNQPGQNQ